MRATLGCNRLFRQLDGVFRVLVLAALLTAAPSWSMAGNVSGEVGGLRVDLASLPERPRAGGETIYSVRVSDRAGAPVDGAKVTLRGRMPDGMTVVAPLRPATEPGMYRGRVMFTMRGRWDLKLRVTAKGKAFELPLTELVGQ